MTQGITTMPGLTIGIDLGDRYSHYCVLDKDGEVLEEGRLSTNPKAFQQRFGSAGPAGLPSRSARTRRGSTSCPKRQATRSWWPTPGSCG